MLLPDALSLYLEIMTTILEDEHKEHFIIFLIMVKLPKEKVLVNKKSENLVAIDSRVT